MVKVSGEMTFAVLAERIRELEKQNAALVEALEGVEWAIPSALPNRYICPWCRNYKHEGHKDNCLREQALAQAK